MSKVEPTITGHVELSVDRHGIVATLTVTSDPAGRSWSTADVAQLVKQKGVTLDADMDAVRAVLENMQRDGAAQDTVVVAEGLPPSEAVPEAVEYYDLNLPEELAEQAERVLSAASDPEIFVNRKRKIEKQKTERKKSWLPFMPDKEERVMVTETETVPERVYVDPSVEQTAYVAEGAAVGRFQPQKPGTPGRNVYGMLVHPRPLTDPKYYLGNGLERRGEELIASVSGFLRVGSNWADIVHYAPHRWEVELSEDRATCFVRLSPGTPDAPLPSGADALQQALETGMQRDQLLPAGEIEQALVEAARRGTDSRVPITVSRDADIDVHISDDRLTAVLTLSKGKGRGKPLVLKEVGQAIRSAGLARLDKKRIQEDIVAFYHSEETELVGYVLAEGTPPGEGPPRDLLFSVRVIPGPEQRGLLERAASDPRALDGVASVAEFPLDAVQEMALVSREQRVLTIPPPAEGTPGSDVFGKPLKGIAAPEPPLKLFENLTRSGPAVIAEIDGVLDRAEVDGTTLLRLRPHRDAQVSVTVTQDRMKAFLSLADGTGTGKRINEESVYEALERHSVRHGIRHDVVKEAVRRAMDGEPVTNVSAAQGTPGERPSEKTFELLVQPVSDSAVTIRADGRADFRNQDKIRTVRAETPLVRILPQPTEARAGMDVTGAEVPPAGSPQPEPEAGAFVRREEQQDGSTLLVAEREGDLVIVGNRIEVRVEYTLKGDVDLSTGNIRFPGSIIISGSVTSGFVVVSGGDIIVGEGVEASLVSADGKIVVRQGVKGAGKGVLRSKTVIGTGFAEQAALLSVGDVTVNSGALHCTIKTNGRVMVQKDRGAIVGGEVRARRGIETPNLGSPNGVRTEVSFGQDYLIADQIEKEEKEIDAVKRRITALDLGMRKEGLAAGRVEALRKEKKRLLKVMEKRSLRLFTLRERFEEHHEGAVTVSGTVHPGVTLESHGRKLDIRSPRTAVSFIFDERTGRLIERPLEKSAS